tara:strand:+ start:438 stop:1271 length:834 start_codon:yes stop_codon:yes gene_type:complete
VSTLNAQKTPTLLIDGTPVKFQGDLSLPYWVSAGKTIAFSVDAISASILEFNINSNELQFNQVMHLTTSGTVPTGKAWKIEAIGLGPNTADIPTSGFSTAATPEIFTSPVTFSNPGTYSWIVPPGITNVCVEAWGGGGDGGNGVFSTFSNSGGGGGGGGYGYDCFTVVPGASYSLTVGGSGQASSLGTLILANGGTNGSYSGGSGTGSSGVGGSSAASFNINGADGAGRDGGTGANGGLGGIGVNNGNGSAGNFPGGGGGGGAAGGDGAAGQLIIYF